MEKGLRKVFSGLLIVGMFCQIIPQSVSADTTPLVESTLSRYVVDDENETITMPDTTVAKIKSVLVSNNGSSVSVTNANGSVVESGSVNDAMKVVVSNGGTNKTYSIA